MDWIKSEPALLLGALNALLALGVGFGLDVDPGQVGLINAAVAAVLAVVVRSRVTPIQSYPDGPQDLEVDG